MTGNGMANVGFKLMDADGKTVSLAKLSDGTYRFADMTDTLPDGVTVEKSGDTLVTDSKGKAKISCIPAGKYKLKEDQQDGYVALDGLEFEVTDKHTASDPLRYTVSNVPTRLVIEKQCGVTKKIITGATFQLKDKDGKIVRLTQASDKTYRPAKDGEAGVDVLPVDDKGRIVICYLPIGKYTMPRWLAPQVTPLPLLLRLRSARKKS